FIEAYERELLVDVAGGARGTAGADHVHAERLRESRDFTADRARTDDADGLAREFAGRDLAPLMSPLLLAPDIERLRAREHHRQHILRDRWGRCAGRVREDSAVVDERL